MINVFLSLPAWLSFILYVGIPTGLVSVGMWIMHCRMNIPRGSDHNEVTSYLFAVVGVLYALLLTFVITAVWGDYMDAYHAASQEGGTVIALARDFERLPEPLRQNMYNQLRTYSELVINDEWKLMDQNNRGNNASLRATAILNNLGMTIPEPSSAAGDSEAAKNLDDLSSQRAQRLMSPGTIHLSGIIWFMLLSGAVIIIYFSMIFSMENVRLHIALVALLTSLITTCLWIILIFSHAFVGDLQVSPYAFDYAIRVIDTLPK